VTDSPALHAANCGLEGCDWSTMRASLVAVYGDLEDHLKDVHDYTEREWRDARDRLTGDDDRQSSLAEHGGDQQ
jgi:predicted small metal-binding protein